MHRCPQCDYAFGPLPGVPAAPGEPYTDDVRCPECGHVVWKGTIVLVGGQTEGAVGHVGTRQRTLAVVVALAPMFFTAKLGVERALALFGIGRSWNPALDLLFAVLCLGGFAVALRVAWRRWSPRADHGGRVVAASEVVWKVLPGTIVVRGAPGRRNFEIPAGLIKSIVAQAPERKPRPDGGTCILINWWKLDGDGRRCDIQSTALWVEPPAEQAPPGIPPGTWAWQKANEIAERILRRANEAPGEVPAGEGIALDAASCRIAGAPEPAIDFGRRRGCIWAAGLGIGMPFAGAAGIVALLQSAGTTALGTRGWAIVAACTVVGIALPVAAGALVRRTLRRQAMRCEWEIDATGVTITTRSGLAGAETAGSTSTRVPAARISGVSVETLRSQPTVVLRDDVGRAHRIFPEGPGAFDVRHAAARIAGIAGVPLGPDVTRPN